MKIDKTNVCVFIENEAHLQQAKELLYRYGEATCHDYFKMTPWEYCNKISLMRMDNKWRVGNSDKTQITLSELEEILKEEV